MLKNHTADSLQSNTQLVICFYPNNLFTISFKAGEDFGPEVILVTFPTAMVGGEMCISFVIFNDDELEGEETFNLDIISDDEVLEAPYPQSWVIITDSMSK